MTDQEKLNDALGELLYAVCIADGVIQPEEKEKLSQMLKNHAWAQEIKWSFDYEVKKKGDLEDVYQKALQRCKEVGPNPAYNFFIEILEEVAKESSGIQKSEADVIQGFMSDLQARFLEDLKANELV
ncbi:MAG: TerB family tellurite resistance protein [Flavobacteriales bacterium]|nr:TerB family tellurite resistance protein [Flavobacteriales bacterium]